MIQQNAESRIRKILQDLDSVRENMMTLSDDIWLSIEHNDNASLDHYVPFKRVFNTKMEEFGRIAEDISVMVQQFTDVRSSDQTVQTTESTREERDRVIAELNTREPHALSEDFTYKRPIAYRLRDHAVTGTFTWRALYEDLLRHLNRLHPDVFLSLPDRQEQISKRGNPYFARDPQVLRIAGLVADDVYIETNLSANSIVSMIRTILPLFDFPENEMEVFLREDRDSQGLSNP